MICISFIVCMALNRRWESYEQNKNIFLCIMCYRCIPINIQKYTSIRYQTMHSHSQRGWWLFDMNICISRWYISGKVLFFDFPIDLISTIHQTRDSFNDEIWKSIDLKILYNNEKSLYCLNRICIFKSSVNFPGK